MICREVQDHNLETSNIKSYDRDMIQYKIIRILRCLDVLFPFSIIIRVREHMPCDVIIM